VVGRNRPLPRARSPNSRNPSLLPLPAKPWNAKRARISAPRPRRTYTFPLPPPRSRGHNLLVGPGGPRFFLFFELGCFLDFVESQATRCMSPKGRLKRKPPAELKTSDTPGKPSMLGKRPSRQVPNVRLFREGRPWRTSAEAIRLSSAEEQLSPSPRPAPGPRVPPGRASNNTPSL